MSWPYLGGIDHDRVIFLSEFWGLLVDDRLRQSDHLDRKAGVPRGGASCQRRPLWEGAGEVDRDRRFAAPALFTHHSDDEAGHGIWRALALKR